MKRETKPNKATRTLERPNDPLEFQELELDPIPDLISLDTDKTSISVNIGYAYQPYAPGKCSVHITLGCDQDTDTIERAVHIALCMARKYAIDGMELIREDVESTSFFVSEENRA